MAAKRKITKKPTTVKSKATNHKNSIKRSSAVKSKPKTKSSSTTIRANVTMEKTLHSKAKQRAVKENLSLNKLVNIAIKTYLNS